MSFTCEHCGKEKYNSVRIVTDNGIPICRICNEKIMRVPKAIKDYEQIMAKFNRKYCVGRDDLAHVEKKE